MEVITGCDGLPWSQPDARHKLALARIATMAAKIRDLEHELDIARTEYQRVAVFLAQSNQLQDELRDTIREFAREREEIGRRLNMARSFAADC